MTTLLNRAFLKVRGEVLAFARRRFGGRTGTTLEAALARCRSRRPDIQTIIDVGASNGCWSEVCLHYFPDAFYFLIEAQQPHEPKLRRFKQRHPRSDYALTAAGDAIGEIHFDASALFGGAASHEKGGGQQMIRVPMTTVDELVRSRGLRPPYLLKLDTHGFEAPIFEGAAETLRRTALIIVETYNFPLHDKALRFPEMCAYLEQRGFRCIDMSDPLYRARDGAFWQFDLYFAPADHPVFASNTFD